MENKLKVVLVVLAVFLLTACSTNASKTQDNIEHFSSKDKAIQNYIKNESFTGSIDLITTTKGDKLLVTQESSNSYFVGELKKDDKGFYAATISPGTKLSTEATGWELNTLDGNKYTIYFDRTNVNSNFISLSNGEFLF
jgi:hypothetical protein